MIASVRSALAALLLLVARPALAEPALWVAHGPHSTVYLFGTMHVLPADAGWDDARLEAALAGSRELWLEIASPDDKTAALPAILALGFDPGHPLSKRLTVEDAAKLAEAANAAKLPNGATMLEPMRPWLAAISLQVAALGRAGYAPDRGADVTLLQHARQAGIPVRGFETIDQQLHLLADLPDDVQLAWLRAVLADIDRGKALLDRIAAAWREGDVDTLASLSLAELRADPSLYATLITDRNRAFARRIADIAAGDGTFMVAVGALHLVGEASVQAQAAKLGLAFSRMPEGAPPRP